MRLDTAREKTITNLGGSQKFQMRASAKAYQILFSGIYERKIEAIVRELSCNAYDSHVSAGKADTPFSVILPTGLNPKFSVEDFGTGLTEQEVYEVATVFFHSTKTENNDVIGALGLGFKTPFSYTDSFTIVARKDGKECMFTASIGQSGEPEVVKLHERAWAGSNGVKIIVDVATKDIREFVSCAEVVYSWFKVKPTCNKDIFFDIEEEILENIHTYGYHLTTHSNRSHKVLMGNVAYSLDLNSLKSDKDTYLNDFIDQLRSLKTTVYFSVAIGDADVAASRETLSLDDRTKENLVKKLLDILENFKATTEAKVLKMDSVFQAYIELSVFERKVVGDVIIGGYTLKMLKENPSIVADGRYCSKATEDTLSGYDIAIFGDYGRGYKNMPRSSRVTSDRFERLLNVGHPNKRYTITVVINDCERKLGIKAAVANASDLFRRVIVISDKNTKLTPELELAISEVTFGSYEIVYASSFWDGKLSAGVKSSGLADETVRAHIMPVGGCFSFKRFDFSKVDKDRWAHASYNGYNYVLLFGNSIIRGQLSSLMRELNLDGIIAYSGNNEAKVKRILPTSLEDLVKSKANKGDLEIARSKELVSHKYDRGVEFLDGYNDFKDAVQSRVAAYPLSSNLAEHVITTKEELNKLLKPIDKRLEIFNNSLKQVKKTSVVVRIVLTHDGYFSDAAALEELKDYLSYIKQRKGQ